MNVLANKTVLEKQLNILESMLSTLLKNIDAIKKISDADCLREKS